MGADIHVNPNRSTLQGFRTRKWPLWGLASLVFLSSLLALIFCYGGYLLILSEPFPRHTRVAVALSGAYDAQQARAAEAMRLLQQGRTDYVMLSVGRVSLYGQWVPDMARRYVENEYGKDLSQRVVLCAKNAGSTAAEAVALRQCLEQLDWHSVVVVTSNYHTRRTRMLWEQALADADPPFTLAVHGVSDGEFQPQGWWRSRRYAKTWILEVMKLVWSFFEGVPSPDEGNAEIK